MSNQEKFKAIKVRKFKILISAITSGLLYSMNPGKKTAIQDLAIEDINHLDSAEDKAMYIKYRELGKDLYFTHPKGTPLEDMVDEVIENIFESTLVQDK